jgi:predicted helicase
MNISNYVKMLNTRYATGFSREHSYRGDLQNILQDLMPDILVTNEPARIACGAPDFILTQKTSMIDIGYIEAKDIGKSLDDKGYDEQFDRYRSSLSNLIFTDYMEFRRFRDGKFVQSVRIAELKKGKIWPLVDHFDEFSNLIKDFGKQTGEPITSAAKLAVIMANKARLLASVIEAALNSDVDNDENTTLKDQLEAFKDILLHDIDAKGFSDIYAQTIAYGMFAARLHDTSPGTFTRQQAAELIPKTNPFLRKLFQFISGYDIDSRIEWIVNALADVFRIADITKITKDFGKATQQADPMIHFYETFLSEYDPALRKSRGVWYTPEPVVKFIVRAVDDTLKADFGISKGLADTTKVKVKVKAQTIDKKTKKPQQITVETHKVQILDPATGTGTFLAEIVRRIHAQLHGQAGIWSKYIEDHLIPRLNGFEILMASYAMAHLKLELLLQETGYKPQKSERLRIYLTNSLEEYHADTGTLFASWLSAEANEANHIKRDTPVMVVLGNPPYSGVSSNMGEWISGLIEPYKYIDGVHFGERKHWLHDDYVKFIRYGQHFVEKNGEGILAYVNNNKFLDNVTFRGMRWNLLTTFDRILIIDLHGSSEPQASPPSVVDKNVFDIKQGVSVNIFIKTGQKKAGALADVFYKEIWGSRESKYDFLTENNLSGIDFQKIEIQSPYYFFTPRQHESKSGSYEAGFSIHDAFPTSVTGIVSMGDGFIINEDKDELRNRIQHFLNGSVNESELKEQYGLGKNYAKWILENRDAIQFDEEKLVQIDYRPFDIRWTYFDNKLLWRWRERIMRQFLDHSNVGLVTCRQSSVARWEHIAITKHPVDDSRISNRTKERGYVFPLYIYDIEQGGLDLVETAPNFNPLITKNVETALGLSIKVDRKSLFGSSKNREVHFAPVDLFDYVYAILNSPAYTAAYREPLCVDFPKAPYPKSAESFWTLVDYGSRLRRLHLLEDPSIDNVITSYPIDGNNTIARSIGQDDYEKHDSIGQLGRVWINDEQFFEGVPRVAWELFVGGYQPAQKWLKDRRGTTLTFDDIIHYQRIIVSLAETIRLSDDIDSHVLEYLETP